jgi:predicted porin
MNKKIIAGAVLSVLSGAVFAQSSVTIYGLIDAGLVVERKNVNTGDTNYKLDGGVVNGSRLGFKGVEDLGGGLSAIFTIESGFTADDGQSGQNKTLFGRQSFVGLTGGFGTVKLGRQYTTYDNTLGAIDPFGNGLAGRSPNLVGRAGAGGTNAYGARFDNSIQYSTPNFGGVTVDAQYAFGETAGDNAKKRGWALAVNYVNGAITLRAAHQNVNNVGWAAANPTATPPTAEVLGKNHKFTIIGGTYDFGAAKLHALYSIGKATPVGGGVDEKANDALIGVTVPFGAHKLFASYINKKDKTDNRNNSAQQLGVGYTYELSKRTSIYAAYAAVKNKNAAKYTVGNATNTGEGSQGFNLGLRHAF